MFLNFYLADKEEKDVTCVSLLVYNNRVPTFIIDFFPSNLNEFIIQFSLHYYVSLRSDDVGIYARCTVPKIKLGLLFSQSPRPC